MTKIKRHAIVEFSAQQIYALVNDVAAYPEFLPWCASSEILQQTDNTMVATLEVQKGKFRQAFTTENKLDEPNSIIMQLKNGPFKELRGEWHFIVLHEHACKVTFELDFAFNNKILALILDPLFKQMANTMITAFSKRAEDVYGEN